MVEPVRPAVNIAEYFSIDRYGGRVRRNVTTVSVATTRTIILRNNPKRVFVLILNTWGSFVVIDLTGVGTIYDIIVPGNNGMVTFDVEEDGESIAGELYGRANRAGATVIVYEVERV